MQESCKTKALVNYTCVDCTCGKNSNFTFENEVEFDGLFLKPETEGEFAFCPQNKEIRLKRLGYSSHGGIGEFTSASIEGRKNILKKRATSDFKKNIEERKRHMLKNDFSGKS